MLELFFLL